MRLCSFPGCNKKHDSHGFCGMHNMRNKRNGNPSIKSKILDFHGKSKSSEFRSWESMKRRCLNPNDKAFKDYGGRGITVCKKWENSFSNFLDDMGEKTFPKAQIDRIDNNGNYEPGNCKWATSAKNNRHKRNTKLTMGKAEEIRKLYSDGGHTHRSLGKLFCVSHCHISDILNNKRWNINKN